MRATISVFILVLVNSAAAEGQHVGPDSAGSVVIGTPTWSSSDTLPLPIWIDFLPGSPDSSLDDVAVAKAAGIALGQRDADWIQHRGT